VDLPHPLERGRFLRRLSRFSAEVEVEGSTVLAHVANPGRLSELLVEGAEALVHPVDGARRVTACDLVLVRHRGRWVSVDSRAPAAIAAEAFAEGIVAPVGRADHVMREVALGDSRIDLLVRARGDEWLVEVKGCTLVSRGVALFPDAPTERGRRHVEALGQAASQGRHAMVLFVVQRSDARSFRPYVEHDPAFAEALGRARRQGVVVAAHRCRVTTGQVRLTDRLDVVGQGGRRAAPCE
jgi:sugar fermentation stimulation protein A